MIKDWQFRGDFVNFQGYWKFNCNFKKTLWHNCAVPRDRVILEMWLFKGIVKSNCMQVCTKLNFLFATWVHFRWKAWNTYTWWPLMLVLAFSWPFFPFLRLSLILMRFLGLSLFVSKENLRSLKGHKTDPQKRPMHKRLPV